MINLWSLQNDQSEEYASIGSNSSENDNSGKELLYRSANFWFYKWVDSFRLLVIHRYTLENICYFVFHHPFLCLSGKWLDSWISFLKINWHFIGDSHVFTRVQIGFTDISSYVSSWFHFQLCHSIRCDLSWVPLFANSVQVDVKIESIYSLSSSSSSLLLVLFLFFFKSFRLILIESKTKFQSMLSVTQLTQSANR